MSPEEGKKNRRIGWAVSLGIHAVLLLFFFLFMAWREPDPPVPEYGIELNFGLEEYGSGESQPDEPATIPDQTESEVTQPEETETLEEELAPETLEEEVLQEEVEEVSEIQDLESPDVIEPPIATDEPSEPEMDTEEAPSRDRAEEPEDSPATEPVQGVSDDLLEAERSASHGDDQAVTGDKGDPEGSLDSRALYGSQGGGGGPMLDLSGWIWDFEPAPDDTSNENGKIVFEIKIDDRGEIISVRTLEKSVSPEVERIYRQEVEALTFSPVSSNTIPAPVSTGKITFIIRSR